MHVWKGHVWKQESFCRCDVLHLHRCGWQGRWEWSQLLSSCHLHVYGDLDTIVCVGVFLSAPGVYLWTTFSMKHLNVGSYQLLKRSVWSEQPFFGALVPMSEQQDTYVVKWVREWTQAGSEPTFIWVTVMDSTEVGFRKGSNTFPCWSSVAWTTITRETDAFVRFFRSCGGIYHDGRQIKNDITLSFGFDVCCSHFQRRLSCFLFCSADASLTYTSLTLATSWTSLKLFPPC